MKIHSTETDLHQNCLTVMAGAAIKAMRGVLRKDSLLRQARLDIAHAQTDSCTLEWTV
jgi:hypothetical protein